MSYLNAGDSISYDKGEFHFGTWGEVVVYVETSFAGKRCLVLDDEFLIAFDIQHVLEAAGATSVTCVSNSDDALAAIRLGPKFDFAVLDVKLGGTTPATSLNSLTVAAALAGVGTPFIFLTGLLGDKTIARQFPDVPVVQKPYVTALLLAAAGRAMAGRP